jgi:hypothetical protein
MDCSPRRDISRFTVAARLLIGALFVIATGGNLRAQTIEDGIMLSKDVRWSGTLYTHDALGHCWESMYNRTNGNMGTVTMQTMDFSAN